MKVRFLSSFLFLILFSSSQISFGQIEEKTFYVVVGSYANYDDAVKRINELKSNSFELGKTLDEKFYVVAYKVSEDSEEAIEVKERLVSGGYGSDIWISTGIKIIPRKKYYLITHSFFDPEEAQKTFKKVQTISPKATLGLTPDSSAILLSIHETYFFENAFQATKKELKRKRYKNLWLTDGFIKAEKDFDFGNFQLYQNVISKQEQQGLRDEQDQKLQDSLSGIFHQLKQSTLILLENSKNIPFQHSNYNRFLKGIIGDENADKISLDEQKLDSIRQSLESINNEAVVNYDSLINLIDFISSSLDYYNQLQQEAGGNKNSIFKDRVYGVMLGEYSTYGKAKNLADEYGNLSIKSKPLKVSSRKFFVNVERFDTEGEALNLRDSLASEFDFLSPYVVNLSTFSEELQLGGEDFPLLTDLKEKEIISEESGNEIYLGFFKDPEKVRKLQKELENFENIETAFTSTSEKDYFSLKIKNIDSPEKRERVVDLIEYNYKDVDYSIGNNYFFEIPPIELVAKKPEKDTVFRGDSIQINWWENLKVHVGISVLPLRMSLYDNLFFSDHQFFKNENGDNSGALKLNFESIKDYEFAYGLNGGIAFLIDRNAEFLVDIGVHYNSNYNFVYSGGFGLNFYVLNKEKVRMGLLPTFHYTYANNILLGTLEAVENKQKTVIINNSLSISEGDKMFSKMSVPEFGFNFFLEYHLNEKITFFAVPGLRFSLPSKTTFRFKNSSFNSYSNIEGNDRSLVKDPQTNVSLKPAINHQVLGLKLSVGIRVNFLEAFSKKEVAGVDE